MVYHTKKAATENFTDNAVNPFKAAAWSVMNSNSNKTTTYILVHRHAEEYCRFCRCSSNGGSQQVSSSSIFTLNLEDWTIVL